MTEKKAKLLALLDNLEKGLPVETCLKLANINDSEFIELQKTKSTAKKIAKASEAVKVNLWEHLLHLCTNAKNDSDQIKATTFALSRRYPEHFAEKLGVESDVLSPFEKLLLNKVANSDSEE
jgi:outer membrane PBP1 activator LpoA protein